MVEAGLNEAGERLQREPRQGRSSVDPTVSAKDKTAPFPGAFFRRNLVDKETSL